MMKKSIFLISAILLIFPGFFSACNEKEDISNEGMLRAYSTTEGRFDLNENEFITMCILPDEGTNNSSHILRIENHTEKTLCYGYIFSLEYLKNNKWESISLLGAEWLLIELGLSANETTEEKIYLIPIIEEYNNNKKGQYRLTRNFSMYVDFPHENVAIGVCKLSTEFEIR